MDLVGGKTRVEITKLGKSYGKRQLFSHITLTIPQGAVLSVLGPNGSGKTTFLMVLCGLLPPSSGRVDFYIDQRAVAPQKRRHHLGLVAPDLELYRELTAVENLEFFSAVRGIPFVRQRAQELLELVGLSGRGREYVRTFSSGMKQRLKYACALIHQPRVLVLDEPCASLDEAGIQLVESIIQGQRRQGMVVVSAYVPREIRHDDQALSLA